MRPGCKMYSIVEISGLEMTLKLEVKGYTCTYGNRHYFSSQLPERRNSEIGANSSLRIKTVNHMPKTMIQ